LQTFAWHPGFGPALDYLEKSPAPPLGQPNGPAFSDISSVAAPTRAGQKECFFAGCAAPLGHFGRAFGHGGDEYFLAPARHNAARIAVLSGASPADAEACASSGMTGMLAYSR
jgi:hypothetical protein